MWNLQLKMMLLDEEPVQFLLKEASQLHISTRFWEKQILSKSAHEKELKVVALVNQ